MGGRGRLLPRRPGSRSRRRGHRPVPLLRTAQGHRGRCPRPHKPTRTAAEGLPRQRTPARRRGAPSGRRPRTVPPAAAVRAEQSLLRRLFAPRAAREQRPARDLHTVIRRPRRVLTDEERERVRDTAALNFQGALIMGIIDPVPNASPMPEEAGAWVREHVWPEHFHKIERKYPHGFARWSMCERGTCWNCLSGRCDICVHRQKGGPDVDDNRDSVTNHQGAMSLGSSCGPVVSRACGGAGARAPRKAPLRPVRRRRRSALRPPRRRRPRLSRHRPRRRYEPRGESRAGRPVVTRGRCPHTPGPLGGGGGCVPTFR